MMFFPFSSLLLWCCVIPLPFVVFDSEKKEEESRRGIECLDLVEAQLVSRLTERPIGVMSKLASFRGS